MRHRYFEFNGRKFKFQGDLELTSDFFDFILAYGDEALSALKQLELDPEQSEMLQELLDQGLLEKYKGRFRLTPRAVNAMQRKALMEVFAYLKKGHREGHESPEPGGDAERAEGTRPFEFGDPVSEIDLAATLKNTMKRLSNAAVEQGTKARRHEGTEGNVAAGLRPGRRRPGGVSSLLPLKLQQRDFERFETESRTSCSTVVLIDQSGSMARFGRFFQAKKCAMALIALIRQSFPFDTVDLVGFASAAEPIDMDKLPLLLPKPVTVFDPVINLRVPINRLDDAPPHFTNLHIGLLQAKRILARRGGDNKMIFIVTDGQPTAHVQGDYVYLLYPPNQASHIATLKEAFLIAKRDVRICTFALTDDYWDMDWLGFVDDLGRLTRGVTFHCASGDLSSCVMESYLSGRKRKTYIA
ncbi:MAG: hypothetical protein ACE5I3_11195 [Phycisphaerae bacterium]